MPKRSFRHRYTGAKPSKLSVALVLSLLFHVAVFAVPVLLLLVFQRDVPKTFQVQLVQGAETGALRPDQSAPNPVQGVRPEDAPKPKGTPDAVPEEKKPEEKKPEPPKPPAEEKKPEPPKPKEEPKKEEAKKEEPKKEEPKKEEAKKEDPKKEAPKKEAKKEEPKKEEPKKEEKTAKKEPEKKEPEKKEPEKKEAEKKETKKPVVLDEPEDSPVDDAMEAMDTLDSVEPVNTGPVGIDEGMEGLEEVNYAKNVGELTQGSAVEAAEFPTALSYWATLVKRKVDRAWKGKVPPGLNVEGPEMTVRVGFWVNRAGELIENPIVIDGATDPGLRMSCIQAIKDSVPLPPFPDGFTEAEQYITYVFTLTR